MERHASRLLCQLLLLPCLVVCRTLDFVKDGGAIPNVAGLDAEWHNGKALNTTLAAMQPQDVLVIGNSTFHIMGGIEAVDKRSITLRIDGTLIFSDNTKAWPRMGDGKHAAVKHCLHFVRCTDLTFTSANGPFGGKLDGQGETWWGLPLIGYAERGENRPRMLQVDEGVNVLVENLAFVQPPYWTTWFNNASNLEIRFSSIDARKYDKAHTSHQPDLETAFNTDGFDVSGRNIHIHDCWVWNQDDTFCVKDSSENVLIERVNASGVGLTIGSIGQSTVRNVTFRAVQMHHSVKGIYMKFRGDGLIRDILYENIFIDEPESWPIWIGPAQQSDSSWPCAAHPCSLCWPSVPLSRCDPPAHGLYSNVTLRNVRVRRPKSVPGVILASDQGKMKGVVFDNVVFEDLDEHRHEFWGKGFLCKGVDGGIATGKTSPVPSCFENRTSRMVSLESTLVV